MIKDITTGLLFHVPHGAMAFVCLDRGIHVRSLAFSLPHKQRLTSQAKGLSRAIFTDRACSLRDKLPKQRPSPQSLLTSRCGAHPIKPSEAELFASHKGWFADG